MQKLIGKVIVDKNIFIDSGDRFELRDASRPRRPKDEDDDVFNVFYFRDLMTVENGSIWAEQDYGYIWQGEEQNMYKLYIDEK